jgi:hypothetical protein
VGLRSEERPVSTRHPDAHDLRDLPPFAVLMLAGAALFKELLLRTDVGLSSATRGDEAAELDAAPTFA